MKKIILLVVMLFISIPYLHSQTKSNFKPNSIEKGKWALLFAIGENFKLTKLDGLTISIKKHISDANALRLGVSVSYNNSDDNGTNFVDSTRTPFTETDIDYSISLYPTYYFYLNPKADVNVYFGAGLFGGYRYSKSDYTEENNPTPIRKTVHSSGKAFEYGINSSLGVEYFPIKAFSIFAEYSVGLGYSKAQGTSERYIHNLGTVTYERTDGDTNTLSLFNNNVNLGLAVYF
jgi:hypothetical protein